MRMTVAAAIGAGLALTACSQAPELSVDHAWVRLAAVPGRPAVAYFTLHGGPAPATLIAVSADLALRAEMHRSMAAGGMTAMAPLTQVPVPTGAEVRFAPGARHVMLFGLPASLRPGGTVLLTCTFADGERIQRKADVVGAGDPAPAE